MCSAITLQPQPMVSVCTTTYNAEPYVRQTIDGVLMQKTNFDFEYVIADDASTDQTANLIQDYAERYSKIIRFRRNKKNIGLNANFMKTILECQGKYIALLDGDDYWIDSNKLQLQVDFMESHQECAFCSTASQLYYQDKNELVPGHSDLPIDDNSVLYFGIEEMYQPFPFWLPTHSILLRSEYVEFPEWFINTVFVDRALRLILTLKGKAAYINHTTCVYRKHNSNVSKNITHQTIRRYAELYRNVYRYSGKQYYKTARGAINETIYAERLAIRKELHGWKKLKALCSNTLFAFREFRIISRKDILRFPYHFLFAGDFVDWLNRSVAKHIRIFRNS
ncbi:MAG: glycosyltransferase [Planctomycetaceae bacterium]|jgi:glycosyltransferase involved in cell wall biosynthesis|nr:glycosyltransferase [Planctomycetaceae bacterium]